MDYVETIEWVAQISTMLISIVVIWFSFGKMPPIGDRTRIYYYGAIYWATAIILFYIIVFGGRIGLLPPAHYPLVSAGVRLGIGISILAVINEVSRR